LVLAGFLYKAAMAEKRMPRKPMPQDLSELQKQKMQLNIEKARIKREKDANKAKAINAIKG
jgi:ATP-dependent Clp protease ATP-binding subunit ClpA